MILSPRAMQLLALVIAVCIDAAPLRAQLNEERVESAVASGLAFLARLQSDDGSVGSADGPKVATTGLSLLAMLSAGQTQDVGRYGLTVRRMVEYLLRVAPADGYFGRVDGSRMYGQGIAALALIEAYGVEPDPQQRARIRSAAERAIAVIVKAQEVSKSEAHAGGWRYEPNSTDSDLSLTAWNLLALRAARSIGIEMPQASIDRGAAYVMKCYRAEQGGFAYQPQSEASNAMTGVGVLMLCLFDPSQRETIRGASNLLESKPVDEQTRYPYYTLHYVTHAAACIGDPLWGKLWRANTEYLLKQQTADGGWSASRSGDEPGRIYSTAMAVLTLRIPARVLPAYRP